MDATYISPADTAKLIRAALKRAFPRTTFSVRTRTYSMGASVDVAWQDGPAVSLVEPVTGQFAGGRFDGMIDLAYSVKHWLLPDGTATLAISPGTEGSKGVHAAIQEVMPHPQARLVRFGADHVTTRRTYSDAFTRRVLDKLRRDGFVWEGDEGPIRDGWPENAGHIRMVRNDAAARIEGPFGELLLMDVLHRVRHAFMVMVG